MCYIYRERERGISREGDNASLLIREGLYVVQVKLELPKHTLSVGVKIIWMHMR